VKRDRVATSKSDLSSRDFNFQPVLLNQILCMEELRSRHGVHLITRRRTPPRGTRTYLKLRLLSIRYKCRMIRLTDEQWKRIGIIFRRRILPMDSWAQTDSERCVLEAVLWIFSTQGRNGNAAAELPELQNCASALSDLVPR